MLSGGEIKIDKICKAADFQGDADKLAYCKEEAKKVIDQVDDLCTVVFPTEPVNIGLCKTNNKARVWKTPIGINFTKGYLAQKLKFKTPNKGEAANMQEALAQVVNVSKAYVKAPAPKKGDSVSVIKDKIIGDAGAERFVKELEKVVERADPAKKNDVQNILDNVMSQLNGATEGDVDAIKEALKEPTHGTVKGHVLGFKIQQVSGEMTPASNMKEAQAVMEAAGSAQAQPSAVGETSSGWFVDAEFGYESMDNSTASFVGGGSTTARSPGNNDPSSPGYGTPDVPPATGLISSARGISDLNQDNSNTSSDDISEINFIKLFGVGAGYHWMQQAGNVALVYGGGAMLRVFKGTANRPELVGFNYRGLFALNSHADFGVVLSSGIELMAKGGLTFSLVSGPIPQGKEVSIKDPGMIASVRGSLGFGYRFSTGVFLGLEGGVEYQPTSFLGINRGTVRGAPGVAEQSFENLGFTDRGFISITATRPF